MCTWRFSFLLFVVVHKMEHVMHHGSSKRAFMAQNFIVEEKPKLVLEEKEFPELTYFVLWWKYKMIP